jgi:hypothetical protein
LAASYVATVAVYGPGFSASAIVHVVPPAAATHPGELGVRFALTVLALEQPEHPAAGAIAAEIDCVDADTYCGFAFEALLARGIVITIDAAAGELLPPLLAGRMLPAFEPPPPHAETDRATTTAAIARTMFFIIAQPIRTW